MNLLKKKYFHDNMMIHIIFILDYLQATYKAI